MKVFDRNDLKEAIRGSIKRVYEAQTADLDLYRNTIDCFSAAIDSTAQGISLDDWMKQEKKRQVQKTKQNAIGSLHEEAMGSLAGVVNLDVGNLIDIVCEDKKIIAEIKNKYNTTKGNHKTQVYRDLASALKDKPGYTGYYVEVLPVNGKSYNVPYTPSDNQTKQKLPSREDIRKIDGQSFYTLLTGSRNALKEVYSLLPQLTAEIINEEFGTALNSGLVTSSTAFDFNFKKPYGY